LLEVREMECQRCGAPYAEGDNYCAKCGVELEPRLPVPIPSSGSPVRWEPLRDLVVRGAAALLVGTAAELARRQVRQHLSPSALADRIEGLLRRRSTRPSKPTRIPVRVVTEEQEPVVPPQEAQVTVYRAAFFQRIRIWKS
jgi:hypothetical protein